MKVVKTDIAGVLLFEPEPIVDGRGFFARAWDREELVARDLDPHIAQISIAYNVLEGTLRGLHYQAEPHAESKTIRCTVGAVWDVAVDLRPGSPTRHAWVGFELSATNRRALYVPSGCAHGYITLADGTEILYQISTAYRPEAARGHRWDDPAFGIAWPIAIAQISDRDATYPLLHAE